MKGQNVLNFVLPDNLGGDEITLNVHWIGRPTIRPRHNGPIEAQDSGEEAYVQITAWEPTPEAKGTGVLLMQQLNQERRNLPPALAKTLQDLEEAIADAAQTHAHAWTQGIVDYYADLARSA